MKVRAGYRAVVVYLTDGSNSYRRTFGIRLGPSPEKLRVIRRQEAHASARMLGISAFEDLIFLGYADGHLEALVEDATLKAADVLKGIKPTEVYFPSEADFHSDHKATGAIVAAAIELTGLTPMQFRYIVWEAEDGKGAPLGIPCRVPIAGALDLKRKAILAHKSQVGRLSPWQRSPILNPNFVAGFLSDYEQFYLFDEKPAAGASSNWIID